MKRLIFVVLLAGCGGRPAPAPESQPAVPTQVIDMEGMAITVVGEKDGTPVTDAIDALALFEEAKKAYDAGRFEEAERGYARVLELFPDGKLVGPALYNRGLALESLRQYGQAAACFRRYVQLAQSLKDQRDGQFRWGANLVKTGDYPTAIDLYTQLLDAADLGPADRAECYLRRGTAYLEMARYGEAEHDLKQSLEQASLAYEGVLDGNELAAEANFRRAEIYERLCAGVHLKLPVESMQGDLHDKAKYFRQAQHSYIDVLGVRNPYWATAAGLKLGELYESFYRDVLSAEVPPDFTPEMRKIYFRQLRDKLRPLLEESLAIYEKNIAMSQRVGADNEWVQETDRRLARLRALLLDANANADGPPGGLPSGGGPPEAQAPVPATGTPPPPPAPESAPAPESTPAPTSAPSEEPSTTVETTG
jgi:tetratricopeptide (TPR) repeat protein